MISAYQTAASALQAYGMKINANANNIANSQIRGYKRTNVSLATQPQGGVEATVTSVNAQGPTTSQATSSGLEQSNVDLVSELTDMTMNTDAYKANLKTIQTADQMSKSLLDIMA